MHLMLACDACAEAQDGFLLSSTLHILHRVFTCMESACLALSSSLCNWRTCSRLNYCLVCQAVLCCPVLCCAVLCCAVQGGGGSATSH